MAVFGFGPFVFDPHEGRLEHQPSGQQATLRPQVARLLQALVERPQELVEREALYRAVWDEGVVVDFEAGLAAALRELRSELKALGEPETWIETVPRRGIRLSAPVSVSEPARSGAARHRRWIIAVSVAVALLMAVLVVMMAWQELREPVPLASSSTTLAVLPFSQFGTPAPGHRRLDLLLADLLLGELWELGPEGLSLIGRASLAPYTQRDNVAALVARDLGVGLLIEGSVLYEDDMIEVSARLLAMPDGRILWSESRRYEADAMPPASEIASALAESLVRAWPPQRD